MTILELTLPDSLAEEARAAGLLEPQAIERLLREALRRAAFDEFLAVAERAEAAGASPLSEADVNAEIQAYRQEVRSTRDPG